MDNKKTRKNLSEFQHLLLWVGVEQLFTQLNATFPQGIFEVILSEKKKTKNWEICQKTKKEREVKTKNK